MSLEILGLRRIRKHVLPLLAIASTAAAAACALGLLRYRRKAEQADQALSAQTAAWNEERYRIEQARVQSEELSRLKSDFLATLSHEIRTPMNAILGLTDLALATKLTQEQREYLQTVRASGESLLALLNDLLDLSKMEAGALGLNPAVFDLRGCVANATRPIPLLLQGRNIRFECVVDPSIPKLIVGDATRLRQVLANLLSNAAKFTETGRIVLTVKALRQEASGILLLFTIADTGSGIPYHEQERVFDAFFQADNPQRRRQGGTGLGLAISRRLVELQGGRLWVESIPGEGSEFFFTAVMTPAPEPAAITDSSPGRNVLLVEDNPVNRKLAEALLRKQNHRVTVAANGVEAVERFQELPFDVILMDIQMPEMDGVEATRRIRSLEAERGGGHCHIIAMTALDQPEDRERCRDAGMDDFLNKPIDTRQLHAALQLRSASTGQ